MANLRCCTFVGKMEVLHSCGPAAPTTIVPGQLRWACALVRSHHYLRALGTPKGLLQGPPSCVHPPRASCWVACMLNLKPYSRSARGDPRPEGAAAGTSRLRPPPPAWRACSPACSRSGGSCAPHWPIWTRSAARAVRHAAEPEGRRLGLGCAELRQLRAMLVGLDAFCRQGGAPCCRALGSPLAPSPLVPFLPPGRYEQPARAFGSCPICRQGGCTAR